MQAVVKIGSSQYLIRPGQKLLVDRPEVEAVLLVVEGDETRVGQPEVAGAKVVLEDLGEVKGEKVRVFKYTAKSRRRRTIGFRPHHHQILIKSIKLVKSESG